MRGSFSPPHHHDPNETLPNFQIWVMVVVCEEGHEQGDEQVGPFLWMRKWRCCTFFLDGFEEDLGSELVFWFDADHFHEQSALPVLLRSYELHYTYAPVY